MMRVSLYIAAAALIVTGWALAYGQYQKAQRVEADNAELRNAVKTSEKRANTLAGEIKATNEQLAAVRRDRAAIDAHFDALSEQLDEVVRNATDAQRACLALEHGDAIGRLLRTEPGNDNGG